MKRIFSILLPLVLLAGCGKSCGGLSSEKGPSLSEARRDFKTHLTRQQSAHEPVAEPPPNLFRIVHYNAPVGKLAAYLTPDPQDGKKHPAIVWITGGDSSTIGDVWSEAPEDNEQTASAYRKAGIIMLFPSLRGGNDSPSVKEGFLGEVDDILAATDYLAQQPYVDSNRIYLGGHSTGGTLVLLVSELSNRFRSVFSFGPLADVSGHNPKNLPFDLSNERELRLRSPIHWLDSIQSPSFVFEGVEGNLDALEEMRQVSKNPKVQFYSVAGADHFNILSPINKLIAAKILQDTGSNPNLTFTKEELEQAFQKKP